MNLGELSAIDIVIPESFSPFFQKPGALHASPRTHSKEGGLDVARRDEAVQRRIHPAVQRHIWRTHIDGIAWPLLPGLNEISPGRTAQLGIVMGTVDLASEIPTKNTSDECVGREMLLAGHASQRDRRSQAVSQKLCQRARVFVGYYAGDRPRQCRVLRWKRIAAMEKRAVAVVLRRARPLGHRLQQIGNSCTVEGSLATKQARFAHVIVVLYLAQQIGSAACAHQRIKPKARNVVAALQLIWLVGNLLTDPAIAANQETREAEETCERRGSGLIKACRASPKLPLVVGDVLQKWNQKSVFRVRSRQ